MTTTAMMKTMAAVIDPTMRGSCSWSDFGGSALGGKKKKAVNLRTCNNDNKTNKLAANKLAYMQLNNNNDMFWSLC